MQTLLAITVLGLAGRIVASAWIWALDIPRTPGSSPVLVLARALTDTRPVAGFWAQRRAR